MLAPLEIEVLRCAYPLYKEEKLTLRAACIATAHQIHNIWLKMGQEPQIPYRIADKVSVLVKEYIQFHNRRKYDTVRDRQKREAYMHKLEGVFNVAKDIAQSNVILKAAQAQKLIEEHALDGQNIDVLRTHHRRAALQIPCTSKMDVPILWESDSIQPDNSNLRYNLRKRKGTTSFPVDGEDDENNENDENAAEHIETEENNFDSEMLYPNKDVCLMFDRLNTSNKNASFAFHTILIGSGIDASRIKCSETTMFNMRKMDRSKEAYEIKANFDSSRLRTLHFDGKTYIQKGGVHDKRYAIVVSNRQTSKVLDIKKVNDGTAQQHQQCLILSRSGTIKILFPCAMTPSV